MAYTPDPARDASILVQVAFKAAVQTSAIDPFDPARFEELFSYYQESLNTAVTAAQANVKPAPSNTGGAKRTFRTTDSAVQKLRDSFGDGVTVESDLKIIKDQGGDHPDWLYDYATENGVTAVLDQREWASQGNNRPWYKIAPDLPQGVDQATKNNAWNNAKGIWPPKAA